MNTLKSSPNETNLAAPEAPACPFVLASRHRLLVARGVAQTVSPVPTYDLVTHLEHFFAATDLPQSTPVVGALPFDHARAAHLFVPETVVRVALPTASDRLELLPVPADSLRTRWALAADPPAARYAANVAKALALIGADGEPGRLSKVVLARSLVLTSDRPVDPALVMRRLSADASVTTFGVPLPPAAGGPRVLVGATPELLVSKMGRTVASTPLAGSARRGANPAADRDQADALLRSPKDRREHRSVVEWIADRLTGFCTHLTVPEEPTIVSTESMWHLGTHITGVLRSDAASSVELAVALHPTPAVCGLPAADAAAAIAQLEPFDREFFTGAVGWCLPNGDGEWLVSIRCAELSDRHVRLYAGAGIVAGSSPAAEVDETSAKFIALLRALGVDESGNAIEGSL